MNIEDIWSCDESLDEILPAGTGVVMHWETGHTKDGEETAPTTIEVILEKPTSLRDAHALVVEKGNAHVRSWGAEEIRDYFVEQLERQGNRVILHCGT